MELAPFATDESSFAAGSLSKSANSCTVDSELEQPSSLDDLMQANASSSPDFDAASDVEIMFLDGRFDEALLLANRFLDTKNERIRPQNSTGMDMKNWRHISAPISLSFDVKQQKRLIYWKYADGNMAADEIFQVAAIALQSWYELYQKEKQQKRHQLSDKGHRFLLPFLETFTSSVSGTVSRWPMSIDLLTLFIQFLSLPEVAQANEAIFISAEFLSDIRSLSSDPATVMKTKVDDKLLNDFDEASCKEMVVHFFTELLPNHPLSVDTVSDLLSTITRTPKVREATARAVCQFIANVSENDLPRKDIVQQCLQFCNTDDGKWPYWIHDAFRICRTILQKKLREIYNQRHYEESNRDERVWDKEFTTTSPVVHHKHAKHVLSNALNQVGCILLRQLQLLKTLVRDRSMNALSVSQRRQIQVSFLVVCLTLFCWKRYAKHLTKLVRLVLWDVVWNPLSEIIQAMKP